MTTVWVVYESMFGNTKEVAHAIAEGLRDWAWVEVHPVDAVPPDLIGVDLLVVGGPTHAFGLSRPSTREDARQRLGDGTPVSRRGIREWLEGLAQERHTPPFAFFDTRVNRPRVPGSAARRAATLVRRQHRAVAAPPMSFWVSGAMGPLVAHELDRARYWGRSLSAVVGPGLGKTVR
ncbi:flavodoxin family protein [Phycicoccus ginsengisoli]